MTNVTSTDIPDTCASPKAGKKLKGFAAMDPEKQREIASKGGKAAHAKGTAHEFDSEEARRAGRKGGVTVSKDRDHMAEIGSRGGLNKASRSKAATPRTDAHQAATEKEVDRTNRY